MKIGTPKMILRKITAAAVPVVAAIAVGSGTAHAQPTVTPDIGYEAQLVGDKIVTTLTNGRFELAGNTVDIKDIAGNTVVTMPLSIKQDGLEFPLPRAVRNEGRVLELTAVKDYTQARPATVTPVASPMENHRAQNEFLSNFGIATAVGTFVGTVLGAIVGLTGIVSGPGIVASVIAGAAIGGIIGTIVVGGPALIVAGIDLINTLGAAPGTTRWADPNR
ncbi:ammonium transporter [Nocardia sp. NPDC052566]|uniref:ammonium transporter n=1 Tax=Nocardia sp. NPDC052566 TaxID=3364330 RepID=UPI0037CB2B6D